MFEHIRMPELIMILVIALVLFGGGKLPEVGRSIGSAIREFKNAMREQDPARETKKLSQDAESKDSKA